MSDRHRFEKVYVGHHNAVPRHCLRRSSREDALDATAETFTVAWRRRSDIRQRGLVQIAARVETPEDPWQVCELLQFAPQVRAVSYLHVVEGLPYDAIGDLLGCTAVSAREAASPAKRRLRRLLAAEVDDATT